MKQLAVSCGGGPLTCASACADAYCGGIIWSDGYIPYHIVTDMENGSVTNTNGDSSGPGITAGGAPNQLYSGLVKITTGGIRGTAKFRFSLDGGSTWSNIRTTAASYTLSNSGIVLSFSKGEYVAQEVYQWSVVMFGPNDIQRINDMAASWSRGYWLEFVNCEGECTGWSRWLEIHPGSNNHGIENQARTGSQDMSLIPYSASSPSSNTFYYAHELGHVVGLPHAFVRADRDRYVSFTDSHWCGADNEVDSLTICKTDPASDPNFPAIPTGSFGVFEEGSVMNYISNDICEGNGSEPGPSSVPTADDVAAANELSAVQYDWSPSVSLGDDTSAGALGPLTYALASGVTMVGSPAACSGSSPSVELYVRGSNGKIYRRFKNVNGNGFLSWSDWAAIDNLTGFDSDPACAVRGSRINVIAHRTNGSYYMNTNTGTWSGWTSLGAPTGGSDSGAAIASRGLNRLDLFVRGQANNRLYQKTCATVCSSGGWGSPVGSVTFKGKPSAVWGANRLDVAVRGSSDDLKIITFSGTWGTPHSLGGVYQSDPAIATRGDDMLDVYGRGLDDQLWESYLDSAGWHPSYPRGSRLGGSPAVIGRTSPNALELFYPREDHGETGLWWRHWPYERPCYWGDGGQCGGCLE